MARTTALAVQGIIEVEEGHDLTPYITAANELVTEVCEPLGYSELRLELIERWLSAHFYTNFDPRPVREHAGPVGEELQGKIDLYLDSSIYGQNAKMLDTKGGLAALGKKIEDGAVDLTGALGAFWLGYYCPPNVTPCSR